MPVTSELFKLAAKKAIQKDVSKDILKSGLQSVEDISVFPKPQRMFPENVRPAGGEYLNPATKDILTGKNVSRGNISITPEGKPSFRVSPVEKEIVGSPDIKGATQIKTNLFKKKAGWKWMEAPKGYEDVPTLVSVENKGKHYYTLDAQFPEGVNLTRYAKSKTEPRLRPTMKGFVEVGTPVGKINVRGKEHIVYDKVINREAGGKVMAGGLSNLKKSININGQPHRLSYINPRQAAVGGPVIRRFMGGYTDEDAGVDSTAPAIDDFSSYQDDGGADIVGGTTVRGDQIGIDQGGTFTPVVGGFGEGDDPGEQGAKAFDQLVSRDQNLMERALGFFTGRPSDEKVTEKQSDLMNKAYNLGFSTWRAGPGKYSTDAPKDYDAWFAAQDPSSLIAGYQVGDPVGYAIKSSFDLVRQQLQNKFKTAKDERDYYGEATPDPDKEPSEMTREELQDAAKDIEGLEDFTPYSGIDYPWYMPGGMLAQGLNFLSRTVIGTGTVGGVGVHVHKDGTVTPVSPEDSPGYDHESMKGENVEAPIRRRIPQQKVSVSESITEEEPLTGMKGLLARRSKPSTRIQSNTFLSNLLDDIYGSDREKLLG